MDHELLVALAVLWCATTSALISFFFMWFGNGGECFHPHSVDVEHRHGVFLVVQSPTHCKVDCLVKSISAFVAPRGSSSSKQFTVLCVMISVAGMLGSTRWYHVKDATILEASLAFVGFASLLLVAAFELDVVPERFLEDKLMVTGWMIEKLNIKDPLSFSLSPSDDRFIDFIRSSPDIYHLYEEDLYLRHRSKNCRPWKYESFWPTLHMLGAVSYIILLPTAVALNDVAEVSWITGLLFGLFCFMAYLTGNYVPVLKCFRGWVLVWNPFLREPKFLSKLRQAIKAYQNQDNISNRCSTSSTIGSLRRRKQKAKSLKRIRQAEPDNDDKVVMNSVFLRIAMAEPELYLKVVGHLLVMSEFVAMLTPSVAIGLQWVTALCDGPPLLSIVDLIVLGFECIKNGKCPEATYLTHCILKS